jgi:hypothetical protein
MAIRSAALPGVNLRARDLAGTIRDLERLGTHVAPRAITFSLNGTAMDAQRRWRRVMPTGIAEPTAFTRGGSEVVMASLKPYARRTFRGAKADVSASLKIRNGKKEDRSAYLAFGMGAKTVRKPGDVGPGNEHLYIPVWRNMAKAEPGIKPVGGANGGLPRNTLKRMIRETRGVRSPGRGARADGGLFMGSPARRLGLGIWARPNRRWDKATGKMVNEGTPHMLVRMVSQASYHPLLVPYWNEAVGGAQDGLARRLERELKREIAYARSKGRGAGSSSTPAFLRA